jgi:type IV pilus assembly protein PilX
MMLSNQSAPKVRFLPGNTLAHAQRGVVLIVALVVLVAMSMGGIAIMRSVDTSTLIAGNIAFKQRTLQGADIGLETAIKWITDNRTTLNSDNTGAAYFSSVSRRADQRFKWEDSAAWANAKFVGTDAAGNSVHYVIHRMCQQPGKTLSESEQLCATDVGSGTGAAFEGPSEGSSNVAGGSAFTALPKMYMRVTVRSTGPRNAVSYVQAMVLIPI